MPPILVSEWIDRRVALVGGEATGHVVGVTEGRLIVAPDRTPGDPHEPRLGEVVVMEAESLVLLDPPDHLRPDGPGWCDRCDSYSRRILFDGARRRCPGCADEVVALRG